MAVYNDKAGDCLREDQEDADDSKRVFKKIALASYGWHGDPSLRRRPGGQAGGSHSYSTNPIIWGCISYTFTVITFANLLIFYPLFLAANFFSIKIVSQKAGEYNYLLHRFPGYSAIENTLI